MRVIVVGDVVTDVLAVHSGPLATGSDTPATIRVNGGGSAANTAAWLASTGIATTLVGIVGDDEAGTARLAELRTAGVHCAVRRATGASTGSVVVLSRDGERTMLCDRGANALLQPSDVDSALVGDAAHLHLSGYALFDPASRPAGRHALDAAAAKGMATSVDAASAAPLAQLGAQAFFLTVQAAQLLFANLDEALVLTGAVPASDRSVESARTAATALLHRVPEVVVKCGAAGAVWAGRGAGTVLAPAVRADAVDSTGAGDAFAAGFLAARLDGRAPAEALAAGAELGALAVGLVGGRPGQLSPARDHA